MAQLFTNTLLRDVIIALQDMSTTNGYYNNYGGIGTVMKELSEINNSEYPYVVVVLNDGILDAIDDPKKVYAEHVQVAVIAYVSSDTLISKLDVDVNPLAVIGERVLWDLKKALTPFATIHINDPARKYLIEGQKGTFKIFRLLADNASKGIVGIQFTVKVIAESFLPSASEVIDPFIVDDSQTDTQATNQ
jgi:hypothetical protein